GIVSNTGVAAGTVIFEGANSTAFTGTIKDGAGTTRVIKDGSGVLTLGAFSGNNPLANLNTFTGGIVLRSGGITLDHLFGMGGAGGTTPRTFESQGGTLLLHPTSIGVG